MNYKTLKEITADKNSVENNIIEKIDIDVIAHFGNSVCFEIICTNVFAMSGYNNTANVGFLIKKFIELFDLEEEDGIRITKIKNIPCRLIFKGGGGLGSQCIGFGHLMKDKFVYTDEFAKAGIENYKKEKHNEQNQVKL